MARIRSIKPDFFTSETIAALPLSARLTFIGLWTYVDDNGVGLDNALLVTAAVWPLESDTPDTLERTREDLANLSRKGLISRYQDSRKRYLHITSWREHQKVDHPGKPRYPQPGDEAVTTVPTCDNTDESRTSPELSREPRESVAPEQGAGSREQGAGIGSREQVVPTTSDADEPSTTDRLVAEWLEHVRKRPPASVIGQVGKNIRLMLAEGIDAGDIRHGLAAWARKGLHPSALPSCVNELMNASSTVTSRRQAETDAMFERAARRIQGRKES